EDPEFSIRINKSWGKNFNRTYSKTKLAKAKTATASFDSTSIEGKEKKHFFKLIRNNNEYKFYIDNEYERLFENESFSLKISIDIFSLRGLTREDIPKIYHDSPRNRIVPIIYINNCLFDNYTMYNPEINAFSSNAEVFRQQTGKIE